MRESQYRQRRQQRKAKRALALLLAVLFTVIFSSIALEAIRGGDVNAWVVFFATVGVGTVTMLTMRLILWLDGDCW